MVVFTRLKFVSLACSVFGGVGVGVGVRWKDYPGFYYNQCQNCFGGVCCLTISTSLQGCYQL